MIRLIKGSLPYGGKFRQFFLFSIIIIVVVFVCDSCGTVKNSYYFKELKKDTTLSNFVNKDNDLKILKNDLLSIQVNSLNRLDDAIFSQPSSSSNSSSVTNISSSATESSASSSTGTTAIGYRVDTFGNIYIHKIGSIHVEGMTLKDLKAKLEKDLLTPYLKDPIVTISFANHRVTILGDVRSPHIITIPEEGLTILDALAMSGDLNLPDATAKNLIIIRDTSNSKQLKHINLEDGSVFKSQWYYLKPNDIVYVNQNIEKLQRDQNRDKITFLLSLSTVAITLLLLIKNL